MIASAAKRSSEAGIADASCVADAIVRIVAEPAIAFGDCDCPQAPNRVLLSRVCSSEGASLASMKAVVARLHGVGLRPG